MSQVPHESPSLGPAIELSGPTTGEDVDPELLRLPSSPKRGRALTIAILAAGAVAATAMVFALAHDAAYALRSGTPTDLGDLGTVTGSSLAMEENRLVRAEGLLGAAGGIRYERPLRSETFRALPVVGRSGPPSVWVEIRVPAGEESGRWEPPGAFVGRLVRFEAVGPRQRGLAGAIEGASHTRVPEGSFLLVDGEEPADARWAMLLAVLFLGFAVGNTIVIGRIVRRVH